MSDDLISRQNAIRWIKTECNPYGKPTLDYETSCRIMEHLDRMPSAQPYVPDTNVVELISRQDAIDALWKALYEYEDKTEKQFQESEDLDVGDWILHRVFVQNMNDIDRQTILNLPSAQQWIPCSERLPETEDVYLVTVHPDYVPQECKQVDRMYYYKGEWWWINEKSEWEKWPDPIIAWMPLPEPYKAERKEE